MIVNHFNTFPYGGAANAAVRLHRELRNQSIDSRFLFAKQERPFVQSTGIRRIRWTGEGRTLKQKFQSLFDKQRLRRIYRQYDNHLAGRDPRQEVFSMAELAPWKPAC